MKRWISCLMAVLLLVSAGGLTPAASAASGKWDGTVDISWYDPAKTEYRISTPAQLAGLAALINGKTDPSCPKVIGSKSCITAKTYRDALLVGAGGGNVHDTVYASSVDFAHKTVYLTADLDMGGVYHSAKGTWSGPNWTPIGGKYSLKNDEVKGDSLVLDSRFNGVLDGQGHTISNLYCNRYAAKGFPYSQCVGIVGYLGGASDLNPTVTGKFSDSWKPAVRNLVLKSGSIYGRRMVGGIVGRVGDTTNGAMIENCANNAAVHSTDSKGIGGIVGTGWGTGAVRNCYNTGRISTTYACPAGGIVGLDGGLNVYNCYNVGKVDSNGQKLGRAIGSHDYGVYTVDNCYYLNGCDDDPASGGWYRGISKKITVHAAGLDASTMKNASFVEKLNASGTVFAIDTKNINDGYPVLAFQNGTAAAKKYTVNVEKSSGGTVTADFSGTVSAGQTVTLTAVPDAGYTLRCYTVNGQKISADFFTVSGDSKVGAVFEQVKRVGVSLPRTEGFDLTVTRTGYKMDGDKTVFVADEAVTSSTELLEGNVLTVHTAAWQNAAPSDVNQEYTDSFTSSLSNTTKNSDGTYIVTGIGTVNIDVSRNQQAKAWVSVGDTSWYTGRRKSYTIRTPDQLAGLARLVNREGVSFDGILILLDADVSLTNNDGTSGARLWDGIGKNDSAAFRGIFDGRGHAVLDMDVQQDSTYAGLFSYCSGATVRNLNVCGSVSSKAETSYAGGVVGYGSKTTVFSCVNFANVTAAGVGCGGVAGYLCDGSALIDCDNRGTVSGTSGVGGVAGVVYSAADQITRCVNYGTVTASGEGVYGTGGVAGRLAGTADSCGNYGAVASTDRYTGGISGYATTRNASTVKNCISAAEVSSSCASANAALGGLVGYAQYLTVQNCKFSGTLKKASAFISLYAGDSVGRAGTVKELPLTDESLLPKLSQAKPPRKVENSGPSTVTFVADGRTVAEVNYVKGANSVTAPAVPEKPGYIGTWPAYTLKDRDLTVHAAYKPNLTGAGDSITQGGTWLLSPAAGGTLTIGANLDVTLAGSGEICKNLGITVGSGTRLTLQNVKISSTATALTMDGGKLILNGTSTLTTSTDVRENQNPAVLLTGDTEISGRGTLNVNSGIYNCTVKLDGASALTLTSGTLNIKKTDLLGMEGGAVYAPEGTIHVSGGTLAGYTNSDNVSALYAKNVDISGGVVRLQSVKSPTTLEAGAFTFTGGTLYALGHSGNSAVVRKSYPGRASVKGLSGTVNGKFAAPLAFTDIVVTDDCFDGISHACAAGYFNGTSAATFSPNAPMTRAMFVMVLYRMAGSPAVSGKTAFADTPKAWYQKAILWAVQARIAAGTSAAAFSPESPVTVEQTAVFLARYAQRKNLTVQETGNLIPGVADNAQAAVSWAVSNGILTGTENYTGAASRGMLAKAVTRLDSMLH